MNLKDQISFIIKNPVFANLLMAIILVAGGITALKMNRELFPQFDLDMVTINVPYPGASQEEVEEGICTKLENALEGLEGISKITSRAEEGIGSMMIEVNPDYDTRRLKEDVQTEVDRIDTFPEDAEEPIVKEIVNRDVVISLALYGDAPERTLKEMARQIKDELLSLRDITSVTVTGVRNYEISVEVAEERLRKYKLTIQDVAEAVRKGSLDLPAGKVETGHEEITIRAKGQKYTGKEFEEIVVLSRTDGTMVRLADIASVRDGFVEDPRYARFNGKRAVTVNVYKTPSQDIIKIAGDVNDYISRKQPRLPGGLQLRVWRDLSTLVQDRLDLVIKNGKLGLFLVLLTLWFFLDFRLSFWVGMGIPVSFAGALWFMDMTGQTMNMISMFGLLMATGMIVDDAIVVGENVYTHIKGGLKPWNAAIAGTAEVAMPVCASTFTTFAAFYPLFMVEGIMGKFIRVLPMAVIACLSASLIEAVFILPVHLRHTKIGSYSEALPWWRRFPRLVRRKVDGFTDFVINRLYAPLFRWAIDKRLIVFSLAVFVFLLTVALFRGGYVEFVLFPKTEDDYLVAQVAFPYGASPEKTARAAVSLEEGARRVNERFRRKEKGEVIRNVSTEVGSWTGRRRDFGNHLAQVTLSLLPSEERLTGSEELKSAWREETGPVAEAETLTFSTPRHGPGGKPVDVVFLGRDFSALERAAEALKGKLLTYPGLYDIEDSLKPGKKELRLSLKPAAHTLGITLNDLARQVRHAFYGAEALRIQRGEDDLKVMVRYPRRERRSVSDLLKMRIRTPSGEGVPLEEAALITMERSYAEIMRRNGLREVAVTADLDETKNNAAKIVADLEKNYLPGLLEEYPGISYVFEGQKKEQQESVGSLLRGFVFGMMIVFAILAILFRSYFQPLIIMISIPFGIVGAVLGHYLVGKDLSLMSLFGIVGLSGIVVNDSLVLIDFVNKSLREGRKVTDAVFSAGKARVRAVLLTSVTTVAGLMPLLLEKSLQAQFLIPMAVSISFGLSFATLITLLLVPVVYLLLNDIKRFTHWLIFGEYPCAEAVEPYAMKDFVQ